MNAMITTPGGSSTSWLNIKNEKSQKILGWLMVGGMAGLLYVKVLPWLLTITEMTLKLAALGSIAVLYALLVLNPRFRWLVGFMVQRTVNLVVGLVVKTDPIGVMKNYLDEVKSKIVVLDERIGQLRGAVQRAKQDLKLNEQERTDALDTLQGIASKDPHSPVAKTAANTVERRNMVIARIKSEILQGESIVELLSRYRQKAESYREDLDDQITVTERERKRLKTSQAAFRAARQILNGESIGGELYDEALQVANDQAAAMIGEIQQFIDTSHNALESFEMKQEGAVERVLSQLQEKEHGSKLLQYQPGTAISASKGGELDQVAAGALNISQFVRKA